MMTFQNFLTVIFSDQVHVLSYSIHALLNGIKDQLTAGDIDVCLEPINEVTVSSY